jgi:hypothetical protein
MMCSLARQDTTAAREANFKMSQAQQDSPQTRYLMYKVAMRDGDSKLGQRQNIQKASAHVLIECSCGESGYCLQTLG